MKHHFTLLEVVVALAILALSLAGLLQLLTSSQVRLARTQEKWQETHMLIQAAEYYLLQKGENPEPPPLEVFPYQGYLVQCRFDDAEYLPESYTNLDDQVELRACRIELLRTRDNKSIDIIVVDRFNYESGSSGEFTTQTF